MHSGNHNSVVRNLWVFPESCTADDSPLDLWWPSSRSTPGQCKRFVFAFLREMQGPPPPLAPLSPTSAITEFKQPVCLCYTNIRTRETHDIVGQAWVRHLQSMHEHDTTRNDQCMDINLTPHNRNLVDRLTQTHIRCHIHTHTTLWSSTPRRIDGLSGGGCTS